MTDEPLDLSQEARPRGELGIVVSELRTLGLSPKAVLAFFYPLIASIGIAVGAWVHDGGTLDWSQVRIAAAGLVLSAVAALGAYVGKPGAITKA